MPEPDNREPKNVSQSGGINANVSGDMTVGGDVVGRDKVLTTTTTAGGHIIQAEAGATVIVGATPAALASADETPAPGESPFKGLQYFDEADADLFFGRELLTAKLVGQLRDNRFLAVIVGASGSGKSSIVRAGLVPALRSSEPLADATLPPEGSAHWPIHIITPTARPLEALAASLTRDSESVTATATLVDDLARDARSLHLAVRKVLSRSYAKRLLIVVDQFEELFTLCKSEKEQKAFLDNLLYTVAPETDGPTTVVITLRADFYAHCARFANLREALAKRQEYIGPMSVEELHRAIEEPAKHGGWEFESGLVDLLLKDVGDEPGALPLLSHALLETWKRREGRTLTLKGYAESGRVRGAIAKTAEAVFHTLSPEQQDSARHIFLSLTELGEGTQDTRRRVSLNELIVGEADPAELRAVLKRLADARLVVTGRDETGETVEVAHEVLIREWPTLRRWLDANRRGLLMGRELSEAAKKWDRAGRHNDDLYRGGRLALALEWAKTNAGSMTARDRQFLDHSRRLAEREAAQKQWLMWGITTLGVVAVIAAIIAVRLYFQANLQARIARSRELAAAAISNLGVDPERSILLAMQAVSVTYSDKTVLPEAEDALQQALQASRVQLTLSGHTYWVNDVAFSPDGTRLATASADGTARVWDATSGKLLSTLVGHSGWVHSVAFSPDGTLLATASGDKTARIWDAASGTLLLSITGHSDVVYSVAFSPDGMRLATASWDRTAKVWDVASGRELLILTGHTNRVKDVAFSPDGTRLATASDDKTARIWDATSGKELLVLMGHISTLYRLAFNPNGTRLATASDDKTARIWDATSGKELLVLTGHTEAIHGIAFSPDGMFLTTSSVDGTIKVWDPVAGKSLFTLTGHSSPVDSIAYSRDGTRLASASRDRTAKVWDATIGHTSSVSGVAFSPDGTRLATASDDKTAKVWDVASGRELLTLTGHSDRVKDVAFSPDGTRLATASDDKTVKVWDVVSGKLLLTLSGHTDYVSVVAFSPDGTRLATAGLDWTAKIWDALTGQLLLTLTGHTDWINGIAFSPDGTRLFTASGDGTTRVWDVASGEELLTLSTGIVRDVAVSADGTRLATANDDGTARIWDALSGKALLTFSGHSNVVYGVAFSPDGTRLATASWDRTAIVWDVASGKELLTLHHTAEIYRLAFSPDGKRLATTSTDSKVNIYLLNIEDLMALARTRVTRSLTPEECQKYLHQKPCPPGP